MTKHKIMNKSEMFEKSLINRQRRREMKVTFSETIPVFAQYCHAAAGKPPFHHTLQRYHYEHCAIL